VLDLEWRRREIPADWGARWREEDEQSATQLRRSAYAGKPLASRELAVQWGNRFGRLWTSGRPRRRPPAATGLGNEGSQLALF